MLALAGMTSRMLASLNRATLVSILALIALLAGCGAKTGLDQSEMDASPDVEPDVPDVPDAEPDVVIDVMPDVEPDVPPTPELRAICEEPEVFTAPRRPVDLTARAEGTAVAVTETWEIVERPSDETAELSTTDGPRTTLTPTVMGDFLVRFTVSDGMGLMDSCDVVVRSVIEPPTAICPDGELFANVGEQLQLDGSGMDDDAVVGYQWDVIEGPGEVDFTTPTEPSTLMSAMAGGIYRVRLTVTDNDGARDSCEVQVRINAPPLLSCPMDEIEAPTRQRTEITARATDDFGIASVAWEIVDRPATSREATLAPLDQETTFITPDKPGLYRLRFTARDSDGLTSSCDVNVRATPTPPTLMCPGAIDGTPLTSVPLSATWVDDGEVVSFIWELVERPAGSSASGPQPRNAERSNFTPDVAGEYVIRFTAIDNDGDSAQCDVLIRAIPDEGLRIEIFWNGPPDNSCDLMGAGPDCDASDVDLHLLRPGTEAWFDNNGDCHYANCTESMGGIEWGEAGPVDNGRLDIDDVEGFGPENINIDEPAPGTYRVGVHMYDTAGQGAATVTVNIYCGMGEIDPEATFGPIALNGARTVANDASNDMWRVADVEITDLGCNITDLALADGRPAIISRAASEATR